MAKRARSIEANEAASTATRARRTMTPEENVLVRDAVIQAIMLDKPVDQAALRKAMPHISASAVNSAVERWRKRVKGAEQARQADAAREKFFGTKAPLPIAVRPPSTSTKRQQASTSLQPREEHETTASLLLAVSNTPYPTSEASSVAFPAEGAFDQLVLVSERERASTLRTAAAMASHSDQSLGEITNILQELTQINNSTVMEDHTSVREDTSDLPADMSIAVSDSLRHVRDKSSSQATGVSTEIQQVRDELAQAKEEIKALKEQAETSATHATKVSTALRQARDELSHHREEIKTLKEELENSAAQASGVSTELRRADEELVHTREEVKSWKKQADTSFTHATEASTQVEQTRAQLELVKENLKSLKKELETSATQATGVSTELQQTRVELAQAREEIKALKQEAETKSTRAAEVSTQLQQARDQLARGNGKPGEDETVQRLKKELEDAKMREATQATEIKHLQDKVSMKMLVIKSQGEQFEQSTQSRVADERMIFADRLAQEKAAFQERLAATCNKYEWMIRDNQHRYSYQLAQAQSALEEMRQRYVGAQLVVDLRNAFTFLDEALKLLMVEVSKAATFDVVNKKPIADHISLASRIHDGSTGRDWFYDELTHLKNIRNSFCHEYAAMQKIQSPGKIVDKANWFGRKLITLRDETSYTLLVKAFDDIFPGLRPKQQ